MPVFRRNDGAEPTASEQALIDEGYFQQDPRDFPVWHADIARENRRQDMDYRYYGNQGRDWKSTIKWIMLVLLLAVFVFAAYDAGIF